MDHCRLGSAVHHRGRIAREPAGDAAIVDDAARALLLHMRRRVLHAKHDAAHQRRHGGVEAIDRKPLDTARLCRAAGIVEQAIDPAECLDGMADQRLHLRFIGHVGLAKTAIGAEPGSQRSPLGRPTSCDHDFRALRDEDFRCPESNTAGRAGDDSNLVVETPHIAPHLFVFAFVVRI
jgi:hypothetical protein